MFLRDIQDKIACAYFNPIGLITSRHTYYLTKSEEVDKITHAIMGYGQLYTKILLK